ncbi:hypothetical protein Are01nite_71910 [Actinoplanes regularis]|nr:hypothetical protein Are01nite_71910 [Actinoplanes regularis]
MRQISAERATTPHTAVVSESDHVYLRLFAEAPTARSAELASSLVRCLADYGAVRVHESGSYWKIPEYLEFNVDLMATGSTSACIDRLRALEPEGWSDEIWNHQSDGPAFLLAEIRWAWLTTVNE